MKARSMRDVLQNLKPGSYAPTGQVSSDHQTMEIVDMLFDELMSIFPAHKYAFDSQDIFDLAKKNWFMAMKAANINSIKSIKIGLAQARKSVNPFFPSCGQFVSWCNPSHEMLDMPSKEDAFIISNKLNRQFSEPLAIEPEVETVIKNCLTSIGRMEYRVMRVEDARKVFYYTYEVALKKYASGEIQPIPKAIPEKTQETPEDRKRAMDARNAAMSYLKSSLGIK
jgi:hypothetical protein